MIVSNITFQVETEVPALKERIAELERLLREAHYFAQDDFPNDFPADLLQPSDVCATERYLTYWKDLNRVL